MLHDHRSLGDVVAECRTLGDDVAVAILTADKLEKAGGARYKKARRPDYTVTSSATRTQLNNKLPRLSRKPKKQLNGIDSGA